MISTLDRTTHMVITTELAVIVGIIGSFVALSVGLNVHEAIQWRRLRALLPTLLCPKCGCPYGAIVLSTMGRLHVKPYHKPRYELYRVTCPHCSRESTYRRDGQLNEL